MWTDGPMLAFDVETTGVTDNDYILSSTLIHIDEQRVAKPVTDYLYHEGVVIPEASVKIHGLTEQFIRENGTDPISALEATVLLIAGCLDAGTPLVGMNVSFDLTMLDRNCRRYGVTPLSDRIEIRPVIDPYVLDKGVDRFRKGSGSRKLVALASLYRIPWDEDKAHTSEADALAAVRVAWRIGRMYPPLGRLGLDELHDLQTIWKRSQDLRFAAWLKGQDPKADVSNLDGSWPIRLPAQPLEEAPLW